ncbi:hypothetical protein M514_23466 [Trichuris suis]|uniref:RNA-directed DNA polymerase n=1 Tax=Trichuris suis TaxID=68888 RepID=A0A085N4P6_9BILA|nr:hypothetical protein M514_23466 [Trichuris suis]
MATIGSIAVFDTKNLTSWEAYAEQLECYCEANDITDQLRKRATLLTVIGREAYAILRSIISPAIPKSQTYDQLVATMKSHFMPQTSLIYRRFVFHKRTQQADETISAYITELRQLAEDCKFEATLTERLRDQLVCGLRDNAIQRRLLAETSLTFDEAFKRALAGEAAANQAKEVQAQNSFAGTISSSHHVQHGKKNSSSFRRHGQSNGQKKTCAGCGGQHKREDCKFKDSECHFCHKKGHIAKVCRSQGSSQQKPQQMPVRKGSSAHQLEELEEVYMESHIHNILPSTDSPKKIRVTVYIEGQPLTMEVDSGSNFSLISSSTYKMLWPNRGPAITKGHLQLLDYQRNPIRLLGFCDVNVTFKQNHGTLRLLVSKGNQESLLGLQWFPTLGLNISGVTQVTEGSAIEDVLREFQDVFSETLGTFTGPKVSLPLDPNVPPKRFKARNVPLAIRSRIEDELDRLLKEGVIEPISNPKWSTPIVPVIKSTGAIRLCGDYKVTINTALQDNPYPIPAVNNLLSNLSGGQVFAKIDMAQAYLQLPVDNASAEAQTIITHRGAFKVKRLQFGVSIAPGIFEQVMDEALNDVPGVTPYFDDILIRASISQELASRLKQVLQIFRKLGFRAKKEKCLIGVKTVDFLGYRIDASGIHPSASKLEAIHKAPAPQNQQELQAFLKPLHRLLDKTAKWKWTDEHEESFQAVKKLLTSDNVLAPFDNSLSTTLTCDASPYGVGAVLSQTKPNGQEIDKEAQAVVIGVKKFHHFLYGRRFTLITDHKPLLGIFTTDKPTPEILSPRMLRWTILLQAYKFKPSRSALPYVGPFPFCRLIQKTVERLCHGRPGVPVDSEVLVPYELLRALKLMGECQMHLFCNPRSQELHLNHPGIVRMKSLARCYVWWPNINADIEKCVFKCATCQTNRHSPPRAPVHHWEVPRNPWSRLHIDFAGPFEGERFLIIVDAYSKWLEVRRMKSTTAENTITQLRELFATHGIPDSVVSDNGSQFTSEKFQLFCRNNLIKSILVSPYHPQSNGQVERMVQTVKDSLKRIIYGNWHKRLSSFLLTNHVTPSVATGQIPAELLMGRRLKTFLDRLHPDYWTEKQLKLDAAGAATGRVVRSFQAGDPVFIRSYDSTSAWIPAKVTAQTGPVSYEAITADERKVHRHVDQMKN